LNFYERITQIAAAGRICGSHISLLNTTVKVKVENLLCAGVEVYQAPIEWKLRALIFRRKRPVSECECCPQYSVYAFMACIETPLHFKITYRKSSFVSKIIWINKVIIYNLRTSVIKIPYFGTLQPF